MGEDGYLYWREVVVQLIGAVVVVLVAFLALAVTAALVGASWSGW